MAWVLPSAYLDAEYARGLRALVESSFREVTIIRLPIRTSYSDDVGEPTIALLGDGFKEGCEGNPRILEIDSLGDLSYQLNEPRTNDPALKKPEVYKSLSKHDRVHSLGEFFDLRIGLVTGANDFFVMSRAQSKEFKLPKSVLQHIVSSATQLQGISLLSKDVKTLHETDERVVLLSPSRRSVKGRAVQSYLSRYPEKLRAANVTFAKRAEWFSPAEDKVPDAFLICMNQWGPRLVLNRARVDCTNTLYRVYRKEGIDPHDQKLLALSFQSSFTALDAELRGRRFKSGALKLEPASARSLLLIKPDCRNPRLIDRHFQTVDSLMRKGCWQEARSASDKALVAMTPDKAFDDLLRSARATLKELRSKRVGKGAD